MDNVSFVIATWFHLKHYRGGRNGDFALREIP
jgi:hypothetical protein